jgi:hypothetical protein
LGSEKTVAGVKAGCNGCHAPLAFLAGDIPPKRPAENSRTNEGVSCDLCHSIVGHEGDVPFNFNFIVEPGEVQQGVRSGTESPGHEIAANTSFAAPTTTASWPARSRYESRRTRTRQRWVKRSSSPPPSSTPKQRISSLGLG